MSNKKIALILGAGFSCEAGVPSQAKLVDLFLDEPHFPNTLDEAINKILRNFWKDVFGYRDDDAHPSLEEHFTTIDLAANFGHNLGPKYSPKKLRAIRRMGMHRTFQILDQSYGRSDAIERLFKKLNKKNKISLISLNWDIVAEKHLEEMKVPYHYEVDFKLIKTFRPTVRPREMRKDGIQILKMHGSSNWLYCDSCRQLFTEDDLRKSTLHRKVLLEIGDFQAFGIRDLHENHEVFGGEENHCPLCKNRLSCRAVTFSYLKDFSIYQFQTIWNAAQVALRDADKWLFIGYSMPEADFEFKHILKSAQLGREDRSRPAINVVLLDDEEAGDRHKRFFGISDQDIFQDGLEQWVNHEMPSCAPNI